MPPTVVTAAPTVQLRVNNPATSRQQRNLAPTISIESVAQRVDNLTSDFNRFRENHEATTRIRGRREFPVDRNLNVNIMFLYSKIKISN
jgi:hypothetical protein